jgi:GNAT superfamily N-acetyltransferase
MAARDITSTQIVVRPVTADLLPDLATLFGTNGTTTGCYCVWFLIPAKECHAGWGERNRVLFEERARAETRPTGLLAYVDGEPVGWCAAGPRSRYTRALRSPVLAAHDPAEDDQVWLVPCFFVRVGFRRRGVSRELLNQAIDLAAAHGAAAIEGFPLAGDKRRGSGEAFVGAEPLFASCGFSVVDRPTPTRVVMRRDLAPARRRGRGTSGRVGAADPTDGGGSDSVGQTGVRRARTATSSTTRRGRPQVPSEE